VGCCIICAGQHCWVVGVSVSMKRRRKYLDPTSALCKPRTLSHAQWHKMQTLKARAAAAATGSIGGGGGGGGSAVGGGSGGSAVVAGAASSAEKQPAEPDQSWAARLATTLGISTSPSSTRSGSSGGGKEQKLPAVVVVNALGQILQSAPQQSGLGGQQFVESAKMVKALQQIRQMDNVGLGFGVWGFGVGCVVQDRREEFAAEPQAAVE